MAIEINHLFESNVPDGEDNNLVQPSDWNANHVLSGGAVFRFPQLIEEKVLADGTTTATFSNLNGDVDEEYLLLFDLHIVNGGTERYLAFQFNNDTTDANYNNVQMHLNEGGISKQQNWTSRRLAIRGYTTTTFRVWGNGIIKAKTEDKRNAIFNEYDQQPGHHEFMISWSNTGDNVTSINFTINAGSFYGRMRLYKLVDFNLGGS